MGTYSIGNLVKIAISSLQMIALIVLKVVFTLTKFLKMKKKSLSKIKQFIICQNNSVNRIRVEKCALLTVQGNE